jgi:hypothetical protein
VRTAQLECDAAERALREIEARAPRSPEEPPAIALLLHEHAGIKEQLAALTAKYDVAKLQAPPVAAPTPDQRAQAQALALVAKAHRHAGAKRCKLCSTEVGPGLDAISRQVEERVARYLILSELATAQEQYRTLIEKRDRVRDAGRQKIAQHQQALAAHQQHVAAHAHEVAIALARLQRAREVRVAAQAAMDEVTVGAPATDTQATPTAAFTAAFTDAMRRYTEAQQRLNAAKAAGANQVRLNKAHLEMAQTQERADKLGRLKDAASEAIQRCAQAALAALESQINKYLPPDRRIGISVDPFRIGLRSGPHPDDVIYVALTGAQWVYVLTALACVYAEVHPDTTVVVIPEERQIDDQRLRSIMETWASRSVPPNVQILLTTTNPTPPVVPGWVLIHL